MQLIVVVVYLLANTTNLKGLYLHLTIPSCFCYFLSRIDFSSLLFFLYFFASSASPLDPSTPDVRIYNQQSQCFISNTVNIT